MFSKNGHELAQDIVIKLKQRGIKFDVSGEQIFLLVLNAVYYMGKEDGMRELSNKINRYVDKVTERG